MEDGGSTFARICNLQIMAGFMTQLPSKLSRISSRELHPSTNFILFRVTAGESTSAHLINQQVWDGLSMVLPSTPSLGKYSDHHKKVTFLYKLVSKIASDNL
jgi:hypothetical protein